jgi:lysophospholipase L1-like esterase
VLVPLLRRIRFFGPRIIAILHKHRSRLQGLWSYALTPKKKFAREYAVIVQLSKVAMLEPIAVGMPLPPAAIEERSPGFCASVTAYNEAIRTALPNAFCDIESKIREADREKLLMQDGHHLTEAGHRLYAECIFDVVAAHLDAGMHGQNPIVSSPTQLPFATE